MRSKLSWTHYRELISLSNKTEINYYIKITEEQNLSYRELHNRIKSKEYERLDQDTKNKLTINFNKNNQINDFIKHPILIKNTNKSKSNLS